MPDDPNGIGLDVFITDLVTGQTDRLTIAGVAGADQSYSTSVDLSSDGSVATFVSSSFTSTSVPLGADQVVTNNDGDQVYARLPASSPNLAPTPIALPKTGARLMTPDDQTPAAMVGGGMIILGMICLAAARRR